MADNSKQELENQKNISSEMGKQNRFAKEEVNLAANRIEFARSLTEELKDQLNIRTRLNETDKSTLSLSRQLTSSVAMNNVELGNSGGITKQLVKDNKLLLNIQAERALATRGLTAEEIKQAQSVAASQQKISDINNKINAQQNLINSLKEEDREQAIAELINLEERLAKEEGIASQLLAQLTATGKIAAEDVSRLAVLNLMEENQKRNIVAKKEEESIQSRINAKLGATGVILDGVAGLMSKLGMSSNVLTEELNRAKEETREMAEEAARGGQQFSKLQIAAKGVSIAIGGVGKALLDPLSITLAILDGFLDVNKAGALFQQQTGFTSDSLAGVNTRVSTTVDLLNTAVSMTKQLGINARAVFTPKELGQISDLTTLLGLSEQAGARLGLVMKSTGQNAEQIRDAVSNGTKEFNGMTNSAIAPKEVLEDILSVTEDVSASLGNNPKLLGRASAAAKRLGMDLNKVNSIADGLLDFESSIEAELEAQLLTGKQINLSKARELALNNDLEGVANELAKNGASAAEFASMNRIQQDALAKSLGMSRQELAKSVLTQEAMSKMSKEQIAAARGVSLAESERIDIQQRIQKSMQGLAQAFAPILEAIVPVVEMLASMVQPVSAVIGTVARLTASVLKLTPVMTAMKAATLAFVGIKFTKFITGVLTSGKSIDFLIRKQAVNHRYLKIGKGLTMGQTLALKLHAVTTKVTAAAQGAFNFVLGVGQKIMSGFGAVLSYVGTTLMSVGRAMKLNTLATSANNTVSAISNALQNSWIGKQAMKLAAWVRETAMLGANTAAKFLNIGATTAAAGANTGLATSQAAVGTTGAAAAGGLAAAGAGLGAFGAAAAPAIPIILAIGGALLLASPAIYAFGLAIKAAFDGIANIVTAVGGAISTMLTNITMDKALAMMALGPALLGVSAGLVSLGASSLFALPGLATLGALSLLASPLGTLGNSLTVVAAGIAAVATALNSLETEKLSELKDLVMTTAIAAPMVAATGAITELISGIAGTGGSQQGSDTNKALLEEIKLLRAAVEAGGDVYIDGNKAGQALVLASSKLS